MVSYYPSLLLETLSNVKRTFQFVALMHHSYFTRVGNCNLSKTDRQTNNTICIGFGTPDKSNVDRLQLNAEWSKQL